MSSFRSKEFNDRDLSKHARRSTRSTSSVEADSDVEGDAKSRDDENNSDIEDRRERRVNNKKAINNSKSAENKIKINRSSHSKKNEAILTVTDEDDEPWLDFYDYDSKRIVVIVRKKKDEPRFQIVDIKPDGTESKRDSSPSDIEGGFLEGKRGYIFYKQTEKHMNCLDSFLGGSDWRKDINIPIIEKKDPILLSLFKYNGFDIELYEYSDKTLALFAFNDAGEISNFNFDGHLNSFPRLYYKRKNNMVSGAGYMAMKSRSSDINYVRTICPCDFGSMFTKSTPMKTEPIKDYKKPELLEKKEISYEKNGKEKTITVYLYRYSEKLVFIHEKKGKAIPFAEEYNFKEYEGEIDDEKIDGYKASIFKDQTKDFISTYFPFSMTIYEPACASAPPKSSSSSSEAKEEKKKEMSIEEMILSLCAKLSEVTEPVTETIGNRTIIYGPEEETDKIAEEVEGKKVEFEGSIRKKSSIYVFKNKK